MKFVGSWYFYYKFFNYFFPLLFVLMITHLILWINGINTIYKISEGLIMMIVLILFFINYFVLYVIRKRYENNTFYEFDNHLLRTKTTHAYTLFFQEKVAPIKNILDYRIKQNIILKKYDVYLVQVDFGSEYFDFYVEGEDIVELEKRLYEIIEENMKNRRANDE